MGLYLSQPVHSHGQLYTACATVHSKRNLSIYVKNDNDQGVFDGHKGVYTRNIVYKEIFNKNNESTEDQSQDENYDGDKSNDTYKLLLVTPNKIIIRKPRFTRNSKEKSIQ